jgi:hypothetical protein
MKSILDIRKPKNAIHIFWEHLIKSALAFTGTFAVLFFGPLILSSRRRVGRDSENDPGLNFIEFMFEHPEIQIGACILAVLIYNVSIAIKNSRKKYVVGLQLNQSELSIKITNLYYKEVETISTPLENLEYIIRTRNSDDGDKQSSLEFVNKETSTTIGLIKPSHIIWSDQIPAIRSALSELRKLGVEKKVQKSNHRSLGGAFFR